MQTTAHENQVKVWRAPDLHDAEMLKGNYVRHAYPWHSHEEICLGLVCDGGIHLRTRTHEGVAKRGSFVLINREELHQGAPAAPQGWRCRTIHIKADVVQNVARDLKTFRMSASIRFRGPVFEDAPLARSLFELHCRCESAGSSLDRQSRIVSLISQLLERHADIHIEPPVRPSESSAVRHAREYLDSHLSNKVTLEELAAASGTTPFRLLRAFEQSIGLTPHAYQLQARVRLAHSMVQRREPLVRVAVAAGFADQAHLTRVFKRMMGATPGQHRAAALAAANA